MLCSAADTKRDHLSIVSALHITHVRETGPKVAILKVDETVYIQNLRTGSVQKMLDMLLKMVKAGSRGKEWHTMQCQCMASDVLVSWILFCSAAEYKVTYANVWGALQCC